MLVDLRSLAEQGGDDRVGRAHAHGVVPSEEGARRVVAGVPDVVGKARVKAVKELKGCEASGGVHAEVARELDGVEVATPVLVEAVEAAADGVDHRADGALGGAVSLGVVSS